MLDLRLICEWMLFIVKIMEELQKDLIDKEKKNISTISNVKENSAWQTNLIALLL